MTPTETVDPLQERANALYWNSDDTVDGVAEQLGLRRNALYASIRPVAAGAECPDCGEGLVFPNRSSRTAGRAMCLACEHTVDVDEALASAAARPRPTLVTDGYEGRDEGYGGGGRARQWGGGLAAVEPERVAMIGGAAMLGAVAGAAVVGLFRRLS